MLTVKRWLGVATAALVLAVTAAPADAQLGGGGEEGCGYCLGVIGVTHVFPVGAGDPGGDGGEEADRKCIIEGVTEPAGCHRDWYFPGCGAHDVCFENEEQELLASTIEDEDALGFRLAVADMPQKFSFDDGHILAYCNGYLVARFTIPSFVDAESFVTAAGLVQ